MSHIRTLNEWCKSAGSELRSKHKIPIIDDEADHATVNTGGDGTEHEDSDLIDEDDEDTIFEEKADTDPSKTNMMVRRIIKSFENLHILVIRLLLLPMS